MPSGVTVHVFENNPYAPAPFVLTEVATCLRDSIRAAGHECEHVVNRVPPEGFVIMLGASPELEARLAGMDRSRCAIFNLEQLGSTSALAGPAYRQWLHDWLVLDYHAANIEVLNRENGWHQQALELPIVPSASVVHDMAIEKSVDVLFYGTLSDRRKAVLTALEDRGLRVEVVAGAYGRDLAPAVHRARLVLHIHFYSNSLFPIARVLQPVMLDVPVVCESSVFSELNDWSESGIAFADYDGLVQACVDLLAAPAEQAQRAASARAFAQRIDFKAPFAKVVAAFEARERGDVPVPRAPNGDRLLTNAEIEAILAEEESDIPEVGHPTPDISIVRREPGQSRVGKAMAWVLITFMVIGALMAYHW